jgi:hypothetical protein
MQGKNFFANWVTESSEFSVGGLAVGMVGRLAVDNVNRNNEKYFSEEAATFLKKAD